MKKQQGDLINPEDPFLILKCDIPQASMGIERAFQSDYLLDNTITEIHLASYWLDPCQRRTVLLLQLKHMSRSFTK